MSVLFRFPFRWGPETVTVPTPTPAAPPLWTNVGKAGLSWTANRAGITPRFEHIFPEADTGPRFIKDTDVVD